MLSLTDRFDAFWDETQEHQVLITQDMEALLAARQPGNHSPQSTVPPRPARTTYCCTPAPATAVATVVTRLLTREVSFTLSYSFIASGDTGHICLGGGVWVVIGFLFGWHSFVMGYFDFRIPAVVCQVRCLVYVFLRVGHCFFSVLVFLVTGSPQY